LDNSASSSSSSLRLSQQQIDRSIQSLTNKSTTILRFPQNSCLPLLSVIRKKKKLKLQNLSQSIQTDRQQKKKKTNKRSNPATHHNFFFFFFSSSSSSSSSSSCLVHFKTKKKTPKKRLKNGAQIPTLHLLPLLLSSLQRTVPEASLDPVTKRRRRVLFRRATEKLFPELQTLFHKPKCLKNKTLKTKPKES
jgi:hypothetical protein